MKCTFLHSADWQLGKPFAGVDDVPEPDAEELRRIQAVLTAIGGQNVSWGAQPVLDVWVIEQRMRADRLAANRLT